VIEIKFGIICQENQQNASNIQSKGKYKKKLTRREPADEARFERKGQPVWVLGSIIGNQNVLKLTYLHNIFNNSIYSLNLESDHL